MLKATVGATAAKAAIVESTVNRIPKAPLIDKDKLKKLRGMLRKERKKGKSFAWFQAI
jgi:hypothetical protein